VFIQHIPGDKYNVKKAATCTEEGTAKHICQYDKNECGEEFSLPALGHNFTSEDKGDVYLKAKATCSKDAEYYHKCSRCAEKGTSTWSLTNSKVAHVYTNYTYNNDATCTKAGTKTASCNYGCGKTNSKADETHPMIEHVYTNYTYNNDATCTKAGTKTASCNYGCGNTDSKADETHPMIDHVYTNYTYNNDATCTKAGTKTASCNYGCGNTDSKADETHPVTAHVYTNYTYNNDATCTKAGTKTASCNYGCGNTDSKADETHPMTAHDLNREIYNSNGMYVTKCKDCHDVDSYDYSRDIKANWNTICLPFAAQSTAGTKFYTIQSLTDGVITLEPAETLAAGKPALVYTTSNAILAISSADNTFVTAPVNASGTNCLVGTFTDITVPVDDNNYYFGLSANKGTYVQVKNTGVALGAYRAYIKCSKTDGAAGLRQVIADEDINETAISDVVDTLNDSEAQYFDMNGRKMNGLQKGINIIKKNGTTKKVIIK